MHGLIQDHPLSLDIIMWRAERLFADQAIITRQGPTRRVTKYGELVDRAARVAGALDQLGVPSEGRVGSLCWASDRHMELFYGVPGGGRILHTLNPRLTDDQLRYTIDHGGASALVIDRSLARRVWHLLPGTPQVRHVVLVDDGAEPPESLEGISLHDYDELLAGAVAVRRPVTDERQAAILCYTSGTTGDPKGVLYSHRGLVLQAMNLATADGLGMRATDVVLMGGQMFHANGMGLPQVSVLTGARLVLPGADMSGPGLVDALEQEQVTMAVMVAPIWRVVAPHLAGRDLRSLRWNGAGGAPVPPSLSEQVKAVTGAPIVQGWGMTETSPHATLVAERPELTGASEQELIAVRATAGLPYAGIELRLVDDAGAEVAWDGVTSGELQVRGLWVASGYFGGTPEDTFSDDGWLRTGDVATIDALGYLRIVDRIKDVIKSGGLWIGTIELENLLMAHPSVAEAAVVGVPHERWDERPIALVVPAEGEVVDPEVLRVHLKDKVPSFWVPDAFVPVEDIPKTSVGKFDKKALRDVHRDCLTGSP